MTVIDKGVPGTSYYMLSEDDYNDLVMLISEDPSLSFVETDFFMFKGVSGYVFAEMEDIIDTEKDSISQWLNAYALGIAVFTDSVQFTVLS